MRHKLNTVLGLQNSTPATNGTSNHLQPPSFRPGRQQGRRMISDNHEMMYMPIRSSNYHGSTTSIWDDRTQANRLTGDSTTADHNSKWTK